MNGTIVLSRAFRSLRHSNYRWFMLGQSFSLTGNWMQTVGESWLVYRLTGSAFALGAVGFVALVPVVPISLFGGALIDRLPKRRLLLFSQPIIASAVLLLSLLTISGFVQLWHVLLIDFVVSAVGSIDLPARQAFLPEMVGKNDLSNSIALNTLLFNIARIIGPLLAGLVVASAGEGICFLINGLSFLPFIFGLLMMRGLSSNGPQARRTLTGNVIQGLVYLRRSPPLIWLLALMAISSMLLLSYSTMITVFAKDVLLAGPEGLGYLMAGVGLGAALGSLLLAGWSSRREQPWLIVSLYLLPASVIAFSLTRNFSLALAIVLLVGVSTTWMQTLFNTLVQLHVRDDMRGRTMSTYLSLWVGMQRIGGFQAGAVAQLAGVPLALIIGAIVSIACTTIGLWKRPSHLRGKSTPDVRSMVWNPAVGLYTSTDYVAKKVELEE